MPVRPSRFGFLSLPCARHQPSFALPGRHNHSLAIAGTVYSSCRAARRSVFPQPLRDSEIYLNMFRKNAVAVALMVLAFCAAGRRCRAQTDSAAVPPAKPVGLLQHAEVESLLPPSVFFQGQTATVQLRNAGAVRFPNGAIMFAVKVDTGGYSTSIQERYQDYLVTETTLQLGEATAAKPLPPGAYGIGFIAGGLLVMDIGGHTLFTVPAQTDPALRRPTPLQVLAQGSGFRLYSGRTYISFAASP